MTELIKADIKELVNIIGKHLYTDNGIVFRELIQNCYDSLLQRFGTQITTKGRIDILTQKNPATIEIIDNGVGMTETELREYLSVMGKSLKNLQKNPLKKNFIGEYGMGFFSAFIIADKIIVTTKKEGSKRAFRWTSVGTSEYEISECPEWDKVGTSVQLLLQRSSFLYVNTETLEKVIRHYCNYLDCNIYLQQSSELSNAAKFPWELNKSSSQERCFELHFGKRPLYFTVGTEQISNNFCFSYGMAIIDRIEKDTDLYCKRMFVTSNFVIHSRALRFDFVDIIVNCDRFSLDLSREKIIEDQSFRQVASELESITFKWFNKLLRENRDDKYLIKIINERQEDFKKLASSDSRMFDKLYPYLLFRLANSDERVTIDKYIKRWPSYENTVLFVKGGKEGIKENPENLRLLICESKKIPVILIENDDDQELLRRICNKIDATLSKLEDFDQFFHELADSPEMATISRNIEILFGKKSSVRSFEPFFLPMIIQNDEIILNKRNNFIRKFASVDIRIERLRPVYVCLNKIFGGLDKAILNKETSKDIINPITNLFENWLEDIRQSEKINEQMSFLVDHWWIEPLPIGEIQGDIHRFCRDEAEYVLNCFIVCPFKSAFKDVINEIRNVCKAYDIFAETADNIDNRAILEKVCAKIDSCHFAIVDITENNPNVMLELGILIARRKPAIIIRDRSHEELVGLKVPSDIIGIERIEYSNTSEDLREKLTTVCKRIRKV